MTQVEVQEAAEEGRVVIIPVGATEFHGAHLTVDMDIRVPQALARDAAQEVGALVAPPVYYGYNEREKIFPGTISVRATTLYNYLFDICSSFIDGGFKKLMILNGHGTNEPVTRLTAFDVNNYKQGIVAFCGWWDLCMEEIEEHRETGRGGMNHACELETSLLMYLDPDAVREDLIRKGETVGSTPFNKYDLAKHVNVWVAEWVGNLTRSGLMGDPTKASREKGELWYNAAKGRLVEFLKVFREQEFYQPDDVRLDGRDLPRVED
jgi:creatinine amidohydrolase